MIQFPLNFLFLLQGLRRSVVSSSNLHFYIIRSVSVRPFSSAMLNQEHIPVWNSMLLKDISVLMQSYDL